MKKITIREIARIGIMAAAVYVASAFLQVPIPTAIDNTRLHMGNVMCLLAGMLLGPLQGGLAAGIGSMFFDLTNPAYITSAPFTFAFKFVMAWICGKIASGSSVHLKQRYVLGGIAGSFSYVVLYLSKSFIEHRFILGLPLEAVMLTVAQKAVVSSVNAVVACLVAVPLGLALRPVMAKIISKVYSGGIETAFTKYPVLEPSFLYGGYPCKDLRHKFLMAQESDVADFSDESFPKGIEVIPLPGHFFDMVGFRMPDNVVFLADCISSRETLDKYAVSFIYDVGAYLETLGKVEQMEAAMFVPAHADASADVKGLVRYNRNKVYEVADRILSICREPMCFERILQEVFKGYGLSMNFEQYVLVGSTVRSYLSWMKDTGKLSAEFQDSMLLWQKE